jgi:steroid 5-alpha reductase family enzyme
VGVYTFVRALLNGGDSRFDTIRTDPKRFFAVFVAQGIWVMACTLPVIALNSVPAEVFADMTWRPWTLETIPHILSVFWFWLGMWSFARGLAIECVADWQLQKWRWEKREKKHDEAFCGRDMWSRR